MTRRLLHIAQRDAGVESGGDERMTQGVRADRLVDPGLAGDAPHDPPRGVAVEALAVRPDEDRPLGPLTNGQVDRAGRAWRERDGDDLAALAEHREGAMAAFDAERFDVGAERFGDTQAVDGQ